jgi:replicative DNA helicase
LAATTPTNGFELVDPTPLVCAAQPWREPGNTRIELLNERTPPHSVEAEQGVLGSMLQPHGGSEAIAEAIAKIGPEHFFVPAHRTIFTAICDLWDAGQAVDLITFTQSLRDKNLLDAVGGAFVTSLFTTAEANADYLDRPRQICSREVPLRAGVRRRAIDKGQAVSLKRWSRIAQS